MPMPLTVTTPSDHEVVITRRFDAPRELVFRAYTQPELIRRWLTGPPGWTMPTCEMDARVGGKYRYVLAGPGGMEMGFGGTVREIVPPERIVTAEKFDQDWTGGETLITVQLSEADGQTTLTQTILYSSREARDGAVATGMASGMEMGFAKLDQLLEETAAAQSSSR